MRLANAGVLTLFFLFLGLSGFFFAQVIEIESNIKHTLYLPPQGEQRLSLLKENKCIGQIQTNLVISQQKLFEANGELFLTLNGEKIIAKFTLNSVFNDLLQLVYLIVKLEFIDTKLEVVAKNPSPISLALSFTQGEFNYNKNIVLSGPIVLKNEGGDYLLDYSSFFLNQNKLPFNEQQILSFNLPIKISKQVTGYCENESNIENLAIDQLINKLINRQ